MFLKVFIFHRLPKRIASGQRKRLSQQVLCDGSHHGNVRLVAGTEVAQIRRCHFVTAVFEKNSGSCRGVDVDLVEIPIDLGQGEQPLVHDTKPENWDVGEQVHAEVAIRQLWQPFEMAQRLVAAQWMCVMIRMSLEMEQHQVAEDMVAVP